jgi:exopolysaccharide biosynthesis WecB/TagA/CpsF family protein
MTDKVKIFNIKIDNIPKSDLLQHLSYGILVTPNVDHLIKLQKDREFYEIYKQADWVICDSRILAWGLKFLDTPVREVIPGSSFFTDYYLYHKDNKDVKIFLLGAGEGIAQKAMDSINIRVGRKMVVGAHSPSFGFEKKAEECEEIVRIINQTDATVLVIGVGAPKQEKWAFKYKDRLFRIQLFMSLGATIDFEAGTLKRAPAIFQKLSLEWFYRLCMEPKRLAKRYLMDDLVFFYYLFRQKLGYKNPFENEN